MEEMFKTMEQPQNSAVDVADARIEEASTDESLMLEESATVAEGAGSIGKFKDTQSLLSAYNSLQAEFTRKCQKLAEVEQTSKSFESKIMFENDAQILDYVKADSKLQNQFFQTYFEELQKNSSPTVISSIAGSGIPVNAPPKPTTLEEARDVAKKMLF